MSPFESAVAAVASWLRGRAPGEAEEARQDLLRLRQAHPKVKLAWVLLPHATAGVVCDVFLSDDSGSTLALTVQRTAHSPWSIEHAEPFAASRLLSADGAVLTVQDALLFLKLEAKSDPSLTARLARELVLGLAIDAQNIVVEEGELQAEANALRRERGLHSADAMHAWLAEAGLTMLRFEALITRRVKTRKVLSGICDAQVESVFARERAGFERLTVFKVEARKEASLITLAQAARGSSLMRATELTFSSDAPEHVEGRCSTAFARDLPAILRDGEVGAVLGPVRGEEGSWLAQVMARRPAVLDAETRAALEDHAIEAWLTEEQGKINLRWHWP